MTKRQRIHAIISGKPADRCGFWLGHPHADSWPGLLRAFNAANPNELFQKAGNEFAHISPFWFPDFYEGWPFPCAKASDCAPGPLAACETAEDVARCYPWPDASKCRFDKCLETLRQTGDVYRASGVWAHFFHILIDLFGLEDYFVKMHTAPEAVQEATDRVCQFMHDANETFFKLAGDLVDGSFIGNDLGSQQTLMCGPDAMERFVMPWFARFAEQARRHNKHFLLHSCGAVRDLIPRFIEIGVQCLHPLQALAHGMDAQTLARDFKGRIAFMGGVDTQELLIRGTPDAIRREVRRLKEILGPRLIISPSHECILPDIPPANIVAMAEAAAE